MTTVGLDICALNPSVKAHSARGIGRYVGALKAYFDANVDPELSVSYFDSIAETKKNALSGIVDLLPVGQATVRQQVLYPYQLRKLKSENSFLHFPAHMDAPSWCKIPTIVTVLDLIPLIFKDLYAPEQGNWRFKLARYLEIRAIKNARLIIAISEQTAKDAESLLQIPRNRIVVTPLGVDNNFLNPPSNLNKISLEGLDFPNRPYFVYVGGIDPRKNIPSLLVGFAKLLKRSDITINPQLVLAGKFQNERNYPALKTLIQTLNIEESVIMPGFVSDIDLIPLLQSATAFVFPSLYEGFGLPPLEALASGALVLSSSTSCMPEILGNAPIYFDPYKIDSIEEVMSQSLKVSSDERAKRKEEGMLQAKKFSWQKTGKETLEAYKMCSNLNAKG